MTTPSTLIDDWLRRAVAAPGFAWLEEACSRVTAGGEDKPLYLALGLVPRKLGKADLALDASDLATAEVGRPGWDPRGWSVDQAARIRLLLSAGEADPQRFPELFETLCATGDVGELVAFYRGLPLYPRPECLVARAGEGARTNMRAVFEAVAHRNPFPRERFDELAWNHMVLKALFVGSPLHPIQGLDARANRQLARMLVDFAHERWAAGRDVSPELWRCVGPFADSAMLEDLRTALQKGAAGGAPGAALALAARGNDRARAILAEECPELARKVESGALTWESPEVTG